MISFRKISAALVLTLTLVGSPLSYASQKEDTSALSQLQEKLYEAEYRYYLLQSNAEYAKENLEEVRANVDRLEETVTGLRTDLEDLQRQLRSVNSQSEVNAMDSEDVQSSAVQTQEDFETGRDNVADAMQLLFYQQNFASNEGELDPLLLLLSNGSVSEAAAQENFLDILKDSQSAQLDELVNLAEDLQNQEALLNLKDGELTGLDAQLREQIAGKAEELAIQEETLEEASAEESLLESMLSDSGESAETLREQIESYRDSLQALSAGQDIDLSAVFDGRLLELAWPVPPTSGLTAFFEDSGYLATFGVQHHATDIRAGQGSPIQAAADGVVVNISFDPESTKYAFIQIAHAKGVETLYGHVSEVDVKIGDFVRQGMVIGKTGATPGTVGAGVRTTGPHLHFEVHQDGMLVDPLRYLPLDQVPLESLPEEYREQVQAQMDAELKEVRDALGLPE